MRGLSGGRSASWRTCGASPGPRSRDSAATAPPLCLAAAPPRYLGAAPCLSTASNSTKTAAAAPPPPRRRCTVENLRPASHPPQQVTRMPTPAGESDSHPSKCLPPTPARHERRHSPARRCARISGTPIPTSHDKDKLRPRQAVSASGLRDWVLPVPRSHWQHPVPARRPAAAAACTASAADARLSTAHPNK